MEEPAPLPTQASLGTASSHQKPLQHASGEASPARLLSPNITSSTDASCSSSNQWMMGLMAHASSSRNGTSGTHPADCSSIDEEPSCASHPHMGAMAGDSYHRVPSDSGGHFDSAASSMQDGSMASTLSRGEERSQRSAHSAARKGGGAHRHAFLAHAAAATAAAAGGAGVRVLARRETVKARLRKMLAPYLASLWQGDLGRAFLEEYLTAHPPPDDPDALPDYLETHLADLSKVTQRWSGCVVKAFDPLSHGMAISDKLQRQQDEEMGICVEDPVYIINGREVRPNGPVERRNHDTQALTPAQLASAVSLVADVNVWGELLAAKHAEARRQHAIAELHLNHAARIIQRAWRTYSQGKHEAKAHLDALVSPDVQTMLSMAAFQAMKEARIKLQLQRFRRSLSRRARGFGSTTARDLTLSGPSVRTREHAAAASGSHRLSHGSGRGSETGGGAARASASGSLDSNAETLPLTTGRGGGGGRGLGAGGPGGASRRGLVKANSITHRSQRMFKRLASVKLAGGSGAGSVRGSEDGEGGPLADLAEEASLERRAVQEDREEEGQRQQAPAVPAAPRPPDSPPQQRQRPLPRPPPVAARRTGLGSRPAGRGGPLSMRDVIATALAEAAAPVLGRSAAMAVAQLGLAGGPGPASASIMMSTDLSAGKASPRGGASGLRMRPQPAARKSLSASVAMPGGSAAPKAPPLPAPAGPTPPASGPRVSGASGASFSVQASGLSANSLRMSSVTSAMSSASMSITASPPPGTRPTATVNPLRASWAAGQSLPAPAAPAAAAAAAASPPHGRATASPAGSAAPPGSSGGASTAAAGVMPQRWAGAVLPMPPPPLLQPALSSPRGASPGGGAAGLNSDERSPSGQGPPLEVEASGASSCSSIGGTAAAGGRYKVGGSAMASRMRASQDGGGLPTAVSAPMQTQPWAAPRAAAAAADPEAHAPQQQQQQYSHSALDLLAGSGLVGRTPSGSALPRITPGSPARARSNVGSGGSNLGLAASGVSPAMSRAGMPMRSASSDMSMQRPPGLLTPAALGPAAVALGAAGGAAAAAATGGSPPVSGQGRAGRRTSTLASSADLPLQQLAARYEGGSSSISAGGAGGLPAAAAGRRPPSPARQQAPGGPTQSLVSMSMDGIYMGMGLQGGSLGGLHGTAVAPAAGKAAVAAVAGHAQGGPGSLLPGSFSASQASAAAASKARSRTATGSIVYQHMRA